MTQATNLTAGVPSSPPFKTDDVAALLRALVTCHRGESRPTVVSGAAAGSNEGFWIKTVSGTAWEWYYYDGTSDILVATFNPTSHVMALAVSAIAGALTYSSSITPTALAADANDYAPTGLSGATILKLSGTAARNITGLTGGAEGVTKRIENVGSYALTFKAESASSTAANRFALTGDLIVPANGMIEITYDSTASRWRLLAAGNLYSANLATLAAPGNYKVVYTDGTGSVITLSVGADKTLLAGNGVSAAPSFRTLSNLGLLEAATSSNLTAGFTATSYAAGTKSSGTWTLDPTVGNIQHATNGGAFTMAPPGSACTMQIDVTNNASAGTITTSGFTKVDGEALDTTNGHAFRGYVSVGNAGSHLTWKRMA